MKKTKFALILAALFLVSGCSGMLNTEGWSIQPHVERPDTAENSSIPPVETYQQLVNTVYSFVSSGVDHGVIHLYNYDARDVDGELKQACNEVSQADPFGSYAVEFMSYDFTRMVKYYQATISITYKHTPEQINSMVRVTGTSGIRDVLATKLAQFSTEAVLRVDYFTEDKDYIISLIRQAYYDTPGAALGMPKISVTLYPEVEDEESRSSQRVVEIQLVYPEDPDVLERKSTRLQHQCDTLSYSLLGMTGRDLASSLFKLLREEAIITGTTAGKSLNTAYSALIDKWADSEGAALAFQLLAQKLDLESTVVQGTRAGIDHFWNVVCIDTGDWRHVDSSNGEALLLTDTALIQLGYSWTQEDYPACGEPAPELPPSSETANLS